MSQSTRLGLGVVCAGAALGVLGSVVFGGGGIGINVTIWAIGLVAAAWLVARRCGAELPAGAHWLALPVAVLALLFAWRDSPTLKLVNGVALAAALSIPMLRAGLARLKTSGVSDFAAGGVLAAVHAHVGALLVWNEVEWRTTEGDRWTGHAAAVTRGSVIALPLLLVFGGLFAAADAVFQSLLVRAASFDAAAGAWRATVGLVVGGYACGLLRGALSGDGVGGMRVGRPAWLGLGAVEIGTVMALLDLLFAGFVAVQVGYLFGGRELAVATPGLTYAEYARSGFFELVTVTALVVPLLLLLQWMLRPEDRGAARVFRALASAQIALLFAIIASAVQRMRVYQLGYGMTELRFYTMAFMGLLAVVIVWFAATALRGSRERFASGALLAGFASVVMLNAANPDARIVGANVDRAAAGLPFDARYVTGLSADAVPVLAERLDELPVAQQCAVASRLLDESRPEYGFRWESWTVSRAVAGRTLSDGKAALRAATCRGDESSQESVAGSQ